MNDWASQYLCQLPPEPVTGDSVLVRIYRRGTGHTSEQWTVARVILPPDHQGSIKVELQDGTHKTLQQSRWRRA